MGDEENSSSESTDSEEAVKKTAEMEKSKEVPKNPFAPPTAKATPAKRKMFSVESLATASKVISTESWLEDTLERKRRRKEENTPTKDAVSLAVSSGSALARVKKQKPLLILGHDPTTRHLMIEIAKHNKEGRIKDMTTNDFTLHSIDLREPRHDTNVDLWNLTNEVIEGQLESLKSSKVRMRLMFNELNKFILQLVPPLVAILGMSVMKNPTIAKVQELISQL